MSQDNTPEKWPPHLGPNDPPIDFSREEAAYEKVRAQMVRDHLGKIALICGDEVVGVFDSADEALLEGIRRFGDVKMMLKEIRDPDEDEFEVPSAFDFEYPNWGEFDTR